MAQPQAQPLFLGDPPELQLNPNLPYRVRGPGGAWILRRQRVRPKRQPKQYHRFLPKKPRRPDTAYSLFLRAYFRRTRLQRLPVGAGPRDRLRNAAIEWKNLPVAQRNEFQLACADDRQRYNRQMEIWNRQKNYLKRPASSYAIFFKERFAVERARLPEGGRITEVGRRIAVAWTAMTEAQKLVYQERFRQARAVYDQHVDNLRNGVAIPELDPVRRGVVAPQQPQAPAPQPRLPVPQQARPVGPAPRVFAPQQARAAAPAPRIMAPPGPRMPAPQLPQFPAHQQPQFPAPQQPRIPAQQGPQFPAQQQPRFPAQQGPQFPAPQQPQLPVPQQPQIPAQQPGMPAAAAPVQQNAPNPNDQDEDMDVQE